MGGAGDPGDRRLSPRGWSNGAGVMEQTGLCVNMRSSKWPIKLPEIVPVLGRE